MILKLFLVVGLMVLGLGLFVRFVDKVVDHTRQSRRYQLAGLSVFTLMYGVAFLIAFQGQIKTTLLLSVITFLLGTALQVLLKVDKELRN